MYLLFVISQVLSLLLDPPPQLTVHSLQLLQSLQPGLNQNIMIYKFDLFTLCSLHKVECLLWQIEDQIKSNQIKSNQIKSNII